MQQLPTKLYYTYKVGCSSEINFYWWVRVGGRLGGQVGGRLDGWVWGCRCGCLWVDGPTAIKANSALLELGLWLSLAICCRHYHWMHGNPLPPFVAQNLNLQGGHRRREDASVEPIRFYHYQYWWGPTIHTDTNTWLKVLTHANTVARLNIHTDNATCQKILTNTDMM